MVKLPDPGQFGNRANINPTPGGARIDPGRPDTGAGAAYTRGGMAISAALERGGNAIARSVAAQGEMGRAVTQQAGASGDAMMRAGARQGDAIARAGAVQGQSLAESGSRMGAAVARSGEATAGAMRRSGDYWADATQRAGASNLAGQTGLAKGMQELASSMLEIQVAHDRQEFARHDSEAEIKSFENLQSFKHDLDYGTMVQRYEENQKKIGEESAASIRNPVFRERLQMRNNERAARGRAALENRAFSVEADTNNAHLDATLESYQQQAAVEEDPKARRDLLDRGREYIEANQGKGYLTAVRAQELKQKWSAQYSMAQFSRLSPEEQIEMLNTVPKNKDAINARIIGVEGDTKNPNSSANYTGQFIESTWLNTIARHRPDLMQGRSRDEILDLRKDRKLATEMVGRLTDDNEKFLESNGVLKPTPGQLYLAHFLGPQGALAVIKSEPGTPVAAVVSNGAVAANQSVLAGKTVDDVKAWSERKMAGVERGTGTYADFIPSSLHPTLVQNATKAIVARDQGAANAEAEKIEGGILDAVAGRGPMPPLQSITENPAFLRTGTHGASKINTLKRQWDAANVTIDVVGNTRRRMQDPNNVFDPTSKDDKNGIQAVFEADGGPKLLQEMNPDYVTKRLAPDVQTTGIIPKGAKGILTGLTRSGDEKKTIFALSAMDRIERANPDAFDRDFGKEGKDKLNTYRENIQFKTGAQILEILQRSEDPATQDARDKLRKEGEKKAALVQDSTILDAFDPGIFTTGPDQAATPTMHGAMRSRFDALYAEEYALTGDAGLAEQRALGHLKTAYNGSKIASDGTSRMMYRPPEKYYPAINGSHDWMSRQFQEDSKPHMRPGDKFATIVADDRTENEITSMGASVSSEYDSKATPGRPPSYRMIIIGPDGTPRAGPRVNFDPKKETESRRAGVFQSARDRSLWSDEYRPLDEERLPFGVN